VQALTLSTAAIRALTARESGDPVVMLMKIAHPDLAPDLRIAANTFGDDIVSNGSTFRAAPFDLEWPTDSEGPPIARLRAMNIDRAIGEALESITTPANCTLYIVMASTPDTVERQGNKFEMRNCQWDGGFLTADLTQANFGAEPWPKYRVTPALFPALFR